MVVVRVGWAARLTADARAGARAQVVRLRSQTFRPSGRREMPMLLLLCKAYFWRSCVPPPPSPARDFGTNSSSLGCRTILVAQNYA